jgi:protein MpaA
MHAAIATRRRALLLAALALAASYLASAHWLSRSGGAAEHPVRSGARHLIQSPTASARTSREMLGRERIVLGASVRDRPIVAVLSGDLDAKRAVLVVGAIHGDEPAGIAIARDLYRDRPPRSGLIVTIPDLNPDGVEAGTRQNARGVDLNRNFPWRWRPLERLGDPQYSGPHALSEPESRIAHSLILRRRPRITVWFHQPLALVDESGGNQKVESLAARLMHLPLRRLTRYPGSAASWQDHRLRSTTAMVVELPPGRPSPRLVERDSDAIRSLLERYA